MASLRRRQQVLAAFGELALRSHDLDEILSEACRLVSEAMGTELAMVMELQPDGVALTVRAGVGWRPGVVGQVRVKAEPGSPEGFALLNGQPVASCDVDQEDRFVYADFIRDNGVRALVNVLILGGDDAPPFGILQVDSRAPRRFDDDDIDFLRTYANLLAAAVERLDREEQVLAAHDALRESEAEHLAAIDLNPQMPWTADRRGIVTSFSRRWLELTGMTNDQALGSDWLSMAHPDDRERIRAAWRRAIATGEPYDVEGRIRTSAGDYRWQRARALPRRGAGGEIVKWYGTTEDIEERKRLEAALIQGTERLEERVRERTRALEDEQQQRLRAEEQLRQSQKMEAVGQLTGGVAHDFNNLLTIIRSSADFLQRPDLPAARRERYVQAISETLDRASKLTGQLLAFARRQPLRPEVFDASAQLASVAELIRPLVGARIEIETRLCPHPCPTKADVSQFETALVNLAVNARDAMNGEGLLTLEVREVSAVPQVRGHAGAVGDFVAISVTDTGVGIPDSAREAIFEPFYTTKEVGQGTGLGLSQVFGFVKQSGGEVEVKSAPGQGSTFTIYLPRSEEQAELRPLRAPPPPAAPARTLRVLLVEDNRTVGRFAAESLGDVGYDTAWAGSADSALAMIAESPDRFDVVFTDVVMPGMNGVDLAVHIRDRWPALPVVLTSGYSDVLARQGAHGFELLHKPYSVQALSAVLRRVARPRENGG